MSDSELLPWMAARGLIVDRVPALNPDLLFAPPVRLFGGVTVIECELGAYSYVSPQTTLMRTQIGRYCSVGANCQLGPSKHPVDWLTTSPISYKDVFGVNPLLSSYEPHNELETVSVGNDVWIGTAAAVMGGVTIGDGSIIAYGSVVTRDVEPYSVVGGAPAKLIRPRFKPAVVARLLAEPWWRYDLVRTTQPIPWRDPLLALDVIADGVAQGTIQEIPSVRHRITRNGTQFSFEKLA